MNGTLKKLLAEDEPAPFAVEQEQGGSPFLITCDHAGRRLPRQPRHARPAATRIRSPHRLGHRRLGVARLLGRALDAFTIHQIYSRLVIDCNRDPAVDSSIVTVSEATRDSRATGGLSAEERQARAREIFWPYHERIAAALDRRARAERADGADRRAQLHAGVQGRRAALACGRAL